MYQNDPMKVLTGEVRLSYCNLTTPRAAKQGGEPKFSVTILIPKTDNATKADIDAAIQSAAQAAQQQGLTTRRKLLEQFSLGSRYTTMVGDASQVADELERWIDVGEIDGFNLTRIVVPETWEDFANLVVPELQNRGRYRTQYTEGSFREKLFGQGDHLPDRHPAARTRRSRSVPAEAAPAPQSVEETA